MQKELDKMHSCARASQARHILCPHPLRCQLRRQGTQTRTASSGSSSPQTPVRDRTLHRDSCKACSDRHAGAEIGGMRRRQRGASRAGKGSRPAAGGGAGAGSLDSSLVLEAGALKGAGGDAALVAAAGVCEGAGNSGSDGPLTYCSPRYSKTCRRRQGRTLSTRGHTRHWPRMAAYGQEEAVGRRGSAIAMR